MNIFVTDPSCVISARDLCDSHAVKMVTETAQMLSSAVYRHKDILPDNALEMRFKSFDKCGNELHKVAIKNLYFDSYNSHPCTVWAGQTRENFDWLCKHGLAISLEYYKRYGKEHESATIIRNAIAYSKYIPSVDLQPFPRCIPVDFISELTDDIHEAYKLFIAHKALTKISLTSTGKQKFNVCWKHANEPVWLNDYKDIVKEYV